MNIRVIKQRRKSMALQLTPKGLRVLIPNTLDEDDKQVQAFIKRSLESVPAPPARLQHPHNNESHLWADRRMDKSNRGDGSTNSDSVNEYQVGIDINSWLLDLGQRFCTGFRQN